MTTTIFIVSFAGLFLMLILKAFEIKFQKTHFLSGTFSKTDKAINLAIDFVFYKYNLYKKIANIFVFEFLPSYLYELLIKAKDFVAKKYYSASDEFRGRRVLRNKGSVSFFLERLSEEKK